MLQDRPLKYFAGFQVYYKKDYQSLERYRNGNRMINTVNVYNCEARGRKLASCSLDKEIRRDNYWGVENSVEYWEGRDRKWLKNERGHEQKGTKNCALKGIQKPRISRVITAECRKGYWYQTVSILTLSAFLQWVRWVLLRCGVEIGTTGGRGSSRHRTCIKGMTPLSGQQDCFPSWNVSCSLSLTHWSGRATSWNPKNISFHLNFSFLMCLIWLSQLDGKFAML